MIIALIIIYALSLVTVMGSIIYMFKTDQDGLTIPEMVVAFLLIIVPFLNTIIAFNMLSEISEEKGWGKKRYFAKKKK